MKRIVTWIMCLALCNSCFSQAGIFYKQYLKNLCVCFQKDTAGITSMNDASAALGKCMNLTDTSLRNKAMREKNLFKTDDESLIEFEKLFALDLVNECSGFKATIEKLSSVKQNKALTKLPILDTVSRDLCNCLELKGVSAVKSVVVNNINECLKSSVLKSFDEIIRQYKIDDDDQATLSAVGEEISNMVMANCKFHLEKLNPFSKATNLIWADSTTVEAYLL